MDFFLVSLKLKHWQQSQLLLEAKQGGAGVHIRFLFHCGGMEASVCLKPSVSWCCLSNSSLPGVIQKKHWIAKQLHLDYLSSPQDVTGF